MIKLILLSVLFLIWVGCAIFTAIQVKNAPTGYEDDKGFHLGEEP
jgi:hypothetical protein